MIRFCVWSGRWMPTEWKKRRKKTFWIFHSHFCDSPINHPHSLIPLTLTEPVLAESRERFVHNFIIWILLVASKRMQSGAAHVDRFDRSGRCDNLWRRYVIRYEFKSHSFFFLLGQKKRSFSFRRCIATDSYICFPMESFRQSYAIDTRTVPNCRLPAFGKFLFCAHAATQRKGNFVMRQWKRSR